MEEEPPATSRASRLLQQDAAHSSSVSLEAAQQLRQLFETKEKLVNITQVALLDFKRQSPLKIKACVEILLRLHRSILEAPDEDKYRKVKESSKVFASNIAPFKAASDFLSTAGWRLKTIDFTAHWVCEAHPNTQEWRVLKEAQGVLIVALAFLEQKTEKHLKEKATTKEKDAAERERVKKAIKDDRQMRKFSHENRTLLPTPTGQPQGSADAERQAFASPASSMHRLQVRGEDDASEYEMPDNLSNTRNEDSD
ncbi:hypothetical protein WJX74_002429 [Apatococcus lobatus]|uniref:PUB domain-containing protein n=2 Tax=Apatococcus TaxID=904362 RepID=A0AAW1T0Y7_9CHLO